VTDPKSWIDLSEAVDGHPRILRTSKHCLACGANAQRRLTSSIFKQGTLGPRKCLIRTAGEKVGPSNSVQRVECERVSGAKAHDFFEVGDRCFWVAKEYFDPPAKVPSWRMTWIEGARTVDEYCPRFQLAANVGDYPAAAPESDGIVRS